ncbi:hypothetical protein [Aeromicrobium sp. 9AM]|uniref:hypothetical protein n=1 Tax=Aeromicrobium sp. 9AM TaxID=2653126 RepID=UPI001359CEE8|nr:hypothetical protein [Aeromicrobium sp. 9AM]
MRMTRTSRELVRSTLDLAIVGTCLSAVAALVARFLGSAGGAHETFVIGFSITMLCCVIALVLAVVAKLIEAADPS